MKRLSEAKQEILWRYLPDTWHGQRQADAGEPDIVRCVDFLTRLLDVVTAYLPRMITAAGSDIPPGTGAFSPATLLFADVSGFTPMSERFSREEEERGQGTEELTQVVNDYFEVVNQIAQSHGGDLLKFGGDAVLSLFDGDDCAARACRAACEMQAAMGKRFAQVSTSLGVFPLRMNIGLGTGPLFAVRLGTRHRMELAILGPAVERMDHSEKLAQAGQTVVDAQTAHAAGRAATVHTLDGSEQFALLEKAAPVGEASSLPPLSVPSGTPLETLHWLLDSLERLTPFLPPGLLDKLRPAPGEVGIEADHRWATTFFAGLRGANALIEMLGEGRAGESAWALNEYYVAMQDVVERYEGTVSKIGAGAGGFALHVLFGAPVAHEDDPERAVRAALEMQSQLERVNQRVAGHLGLDAPPFRQAMGVTSGFVFAGSVGSSRRREYTVMGDEVNLSHRLMSVSTDGLISVAASTVSHLSRQIVADEQAPVQLKGKREPVRYFLIRGLAQETVLEGVVRQRLVGREAERARLLAALDDVTEGMGRVVAIRGEAGVGKTRLALEAVWQAREQGMVVVSGQGVAFLRETAPYYPWTQVLRGLLDLPAGGGPGEQMVALVERMKARGLSGWEPLVGEVLGLSLEETPLTTALDPRLRQQRFFDIVLELTALSTRRQPLLLWLDGAQWADVASLGLLDYVARNVRSLPVMLVATYRPAERLDGRWTDLSHGVSIELGEMNDSEREALVAHLLDVSEVEPSVLRGILDRAQGNPLFVEETVRELVESGALAKEGTDWVLAGSVAASAVPDTVQGVLQGRLDRLPETERRVLQVASVIGQSFAVPVLDAVYPHGDLDGTLPERLGFLDQQRFITRAEPPADHAFRHAMIQEVSYSSLLHARRQALHRAIARFLEEDSTGEALKQLEFVALHYYRGREWNRALPYLVQAGQRAQREYANDVAVSQFRWALRAAEALGGDGDEGRLAAHEALGELLTVVGQYDEALQHLEAAQTLVGEVASSEDRRRVLAGLCRKMAEAHEAKGDYGAAFASLEEGLGIAGIEGMIEQAHLYLMGAGVFFRQGRNDQAVVWCERGLAIVEESEETAAQEVAARGNYLLGAILLRYGDLAGAVERCEESLRVYTTLGNLMGQFHAHNNVAMAFKYQDNWTLAIEHYEAARELTVRMGYAEGQARVVNNLGEVYLVQGKLGEARKSYGQALAITERMGMAYGVALMHNNLGAVLACAGEWAAATEHLDQSLALFAEIGSEEFLAELFRHKAEVALGQEQYDEALAHAERSLEYARTHDMRLEEGMTWRILGRACGERGELERAEESLSCALAIANEASQRHEIALARLELARLYVRQGRGQEATELAEQAIRSCADLGAALGLLEAERLLDTLAGRGGKA